MRQGPPERTATPRQRILDALSQAPEGTFLSPREISALAGVSEKDVADHLVHLEQSLSRRGMPLERLAARCLACGYVFADRQRTAKPGACARCRSTRIEAARFRVRR